MSSRTVLPSATLAFLVLGASSSAQVTQLDTPYLSGCAPCCGLAGIGISALGEPKIGNPGFGILTQNIFTQGTILILGSCLPTPVSAALSWGACPALPGGCLVHVDLAGSLFALQPFAVLWTYQSPSTTGRVWTLPIPNTPTLVGQTFCAQVAGGPSSWGNCLSISNGLSITIMP